MISAPRVESTTSPCSAPASRELAQPAIPSPSTKHPVFQPGTHKSCYAYADYPKPCGNCLRRKETCCFGKKTVPRRNVTKHLHFTRPLKGTEKCTSVSSNTLFYVDQPLVPAQDEKSSQTETSTLPNQPSVFSETASIPASANACATSTSIIPRLYLDHVLDQAYINCYKKAGDNGSHDAGPANGHVPSGKANGIFGSSYRLTYFTESRLASLSGRLRNHKVDDLVHRINSHIWQRLRRPTDAPNVFDTPDAPDAQDVPNKSPFSSSNPIHVEPELEAAYIQIYFERAHPLCPFLDRTAFEARALRENDASRTTKEIKENAPKKAWSVLYYSVLAIGCAYMDSSTSTTANANARPSSRHCFEPGKSTAWRLFAQGALAHFADLHILPEDSLLTLQALTAMSVYGLGVACLSIERVILTEAARRAQSMAQIPSAQSSVSFQRTFWILYGIEKVTSFHFGRSSMFVDSDIACPFPASFGGDGTHATWPILWILHARLLSRTYASLFSVGTACNTAAHSLATIDQLHKEVEAWRLSVPEARGLRPDASSRAPGLHSHDPTERIMTLGHRYMYHSLVLILSHAQLHHFSQLPPSQKAELATVAAQKKAQDTLIVAARTILELTSLIEVEPHTPLWLLAVVPLMALLVLFDVVVHSSPSTLSSSGSDIALNLVLLDMGAGYFSRIEYASGGSLPGSLLSEFAHIARDYVNDYQRRVREQERSDKTVKSTAKSTTSVLISAQQLQQPLPSPPAPTLPHTALLPQATDIPPQPFGTMNTTSSTWSLSSAVLPVVADVGSTTSTSSKEAYVRPSSLELLTTSDMHPFSNGVVFPDGNSGPSSRDGSVYGVNTGYWNENGSNGVDLTGTDVMGLFTSNYYFLPEMDGILYGNINGM
ncbi:hypothetical protein SBRCBS47491_001636 [Sporothrix bragantina]|uniref:Xylanolytic transcriptional activator regulatory domain-containing protein n=1 Tax=Sporothrix bragantina TaxID=671064 RepID=A0ABP0B070_9PEZI